MIVLGEKVGNGSILFDKFTNLFINSLMNVRINSLHSIITEVTCVFPDRWRFRVKKKKKKKKKVTTGTFGI